MKQPEIISATQEQLDELLALAKAASFPQPPYDLLASVLGTFMPEGDGEKLWAYTTAGEAPGEITFTLPARGDQKSRKVRQQLWAREVKMSTGKSGTVTATCVIAREIGTPKGVKPGEWRLLTTRKPEVLTEVIELIDWYRARCCTVF